MSKKVFRKFLTQVEAKAAPYTVFFLMVAVVFTGMFVLLPQDNIVKADPFSWTTYHIDTGNIMEKGTGGNIAIQSDGDIGVVYVRNITVSGYGDNLCYATSSDHGQTWTVEDIYNINVEGDADDVIQHRIAFAYNATDTPFIIFTNRSSTTGSSFWNTLIFYNSSSSAWEQETIASDPNYFFEMRLLFNSSYQRRPMIVGDYNDVVSHYDADCMVYNQSTSSWDKYTITDASTYDGRSMSAEVNSTGSVFTSFLSHQKWKLYKSDNWGQTWTHVGNWNNHADDDHLWGDMIINSTNVVMTAWNFEDGGDTIYFDYYDGSFHTDIDTTGDNCDYNYNNVVNLVQNNTGAIHVAYFEDVSDNVQLCWADSVGGSWSEETIYSGNATNNNDATLMGYEYDNGYHYVLMGAGDLTHGVGSDADLLIAVRFDEAAGPGDTPSSFTLSGYDATHFVTWTGDGGQTIWSNATSYGTLEINYNVNASDSLTDICINIDADDIDAGLSDENITVYVSFDGSTFAVLNDDIGNGAGVCANGLNLTINATTWPASDPGGDPNFPIDPVGTWENDTIYCRFTLAIPSGMSASTYSSVNTDWLVDYKVES